MYSSTPNEDITSNMDTMVGSIIDSKLHSQVPIDM